MRIPLTNIYRAFPELDRFSDDQCSRFVRAACKHGWQRHLHRALLIILTPIAVLLTFAVLAIGLNALTDALGTAFERSIAFNILIFLLLAAGFLPVFGAMLIRDRLLLRRIRYVLRARGTCPACRYSLLGIVVAKSNIVTCPECGIEVEADPSLNELTTDDQGRARFNPTESIKTRRFWTPRRTRRVKRSAIVLAAFLFVGLPAGWGTYEIFLHRQAATARAERPGVAGILEFVEAHQPLGSLPTDADAWDAFESASVLAARITPTVPVPQTSDGMDAFTYFDFVIDPDALDNAGEATAQDIEHNRVSLEYTLEMLRAYQQQGLYDAFDQIAASPRAVRVPSSVASQPLAFTLKPELTEVRNFARINAARMHLARQDGDLTEYIAALEAGLALARMSAHQSSLLDGLVALAIEHLMLDQLKTCLVEHPSVEWVDAIDAAIDRQRPMLPKGFHIDGESIETLDFAAWIFASPKNVRFGRFSGAVSGSIWNSGIMDGPLTGRFGTYARNRDAIIAYYKTAASEASLDPHQRTTTAQLSISSGLLLLDMLLPAIDKAIAAFDHGELRRRGTTTTLALERYYLANNTYPDSLTDLLSDYLSALPIDPWTGNPLIYRPRTTNPDNQTYLLYSVGPDAIDDGGMPDTISNWGRQNADIILSPPAR